ncbi:MAG: hypothetical protein LPK45_04345 [Bacteroidota bacterium]|nr:hypothetical protein [Bacteroidota bacterium]MDX5430284.1 hypothetical protein [Bacteroidota bacterium]MDX5469045.1 hypothetical protein [Bacteroidota bacterium]
MNRINIWSFGFLLLFACTKQETQTISGNKAPLDQSVSDLQIDNYINRVYIGLVGRKPLEAEFDSARTLLRPNPNAIEVREQLISKILNHEECRYNWAYRARLELVEGVDTAKVKRDYQLLLAQIQNDSLSFIRPLLEAQVPKMEALITLNGDFIKGLIDEREVHRRFCDNTYYDQINMGTENFVVSMFQHFLDRYPSISELNSGKLMVDGANSSLFLESGSSKDDFLQIFLNSNAYAEGQIHALFRQYLYRNATQDEVLLLANHFISPMNYQAVQRYVLSTDEFFNQ